MHFQLNVVSSSGGGGELLKLRIDQCIKIQIFSPNCECRALTF